jgi:hypothetical protein
MLIYKNYVILNAGEWSLKKQVKQGLKESEDDSYQ